MGLPDGSGVDVLREIRALGKQAEVAVMSVEHEDEIRACFACSRT